MLGMLQLLTRYQYIEELAGLHQAAKDSKKDNDGDGGGSKSPAPDAFLWC
jgi:hypothetical protein